jgi:hypothetical protein
MSQSHPAAAHESSYRLKFNRDAFLEPVKIAQPERVYRVKNIYFFTFDGFVMYSQEVRETDLGHNVIDAIEFSNQPWQKTL